MKSKTNPKGELPCPSLPPIHSYARDKSRTKYHLLNILYDPISEIGSTQFTVTGSARKLNVSKSSIKWALGKLQKDGFAEKLGSVWKLTGQGLKAWETYLSVPQSCRHKSKGSVPHLSPGVTDSDQSLPVIDLHALNLKIPITSGHTREFGEFQVKVKNWTKGIDKLEVEGITVEKTTKNIMVYVWSRKLHYAFDLTPLIIKALLETEKYCREKGIAIDILKAKRLAYHLLINQKEMEELIHPSEKIEVKLARLAGKTTQNDDDKQARVWLDPSPWKGAETNDDIWRYNYVMMPERVWKLESNINAMLGFQAALQGYAQEIQNHREENRLRRENQEMQLDINRQMLESVQGLRKEIKKGGMRFLSQPSRQSQPSSSSLQQSLQLCQIEELKDDLEKFDWLLENINSVEDGQEYRHVIETLRDDLRDDLARKLKEKLWNR